MQRGLEAIGEPNADVVVTGTFVKTVERLEPGPYDVERGSGVVAAKVMESETGSVIVVNAEVALDETEEVIERLLAHEGGHTYLHHHGEAVNVEEMVGRYSQGVGNLYASAAVAMEEYRIERRLADLGYPVAQRAAPEELDDRLFELSYEILEAAIDPTSADPARYAGAVIGALSRVTVTLGYLAGAVVAGTERSHLNQLSDFGLQTWDELVSRNWADRLGAE